MDEKKNSKKKVIAISIVSVVALIAIIGVVVFVISNAQILKLYNATLELGQENYLEELTKEENIYIKEGYTYSVKDNKIDINNAGTYEVVFEIKGEGKTTEEIKKIQVVDTTPPTVELKKDTFYIGDNIKVEEIVTIKDLSATEEIPYNEAKVKIEGQFDTSKEGQSTIKISVTDKNGVTGTQELTVKIKNPIMSLYDYIEQKVISDKIYTDGSYDNKFVIKYKEELYGGIISSGWINFTDKVNYQYSEISTGFSKVRTGHICYFDSDYKINSVYASLSTGDLAVDSYLNANGFTLENEHISTDQTLLDSEMSRINRLLSNNGNINLEGKTVEQLKNETIDIREMQ